MACRSRNGTNRHSFRGVMYKHGLFMNREQYYGQSIKRKVNEDTIKVSPAGDPIYPYLCAR